VSAFVLVDGSTGLTALRQRVADLYASLRDGVCRSLTATGLDVASAQEATQEAFLRLYTELRDGKTVDNPRAWVYRVAYNFAMDSLARKSRETGISQMMTNTLNTGDAGAEHDLIEREWVERVQRSIQQLSTQQRLCMELRAQGLQYQEIADVLQIRPSTVGEFLRRAIKHLKKQNLCDQDL
jgi:RNA polymerase sigma-70 factor (ECF subfamily)